MTVDRVVFASTMEDGGKKQTMTGEIADMAAYDFDAAATLAMFDPARAKDDKVYRAYRQVKAGAYTVTMSDGVRARIDGMTASELGIKPSKLQFPQIVAALDAIPHGPARQTDAGADCAT